MKRTGPIVVLIATLVAAVAWFVFVFRPVERSRKRAIDKAVAAVNEQATLTALLARIEALEADKTNQELLQKRLEVAVPKTPELGPFIVEANAIATTSGISWISVTPSATTVQVASDFTAIPVEIKLEGPYTAITSYLTGLESAKRLVIVDGLAVSPLPAERTGGQVNAANPQLGAVISARMFTRADAFAATGATPTTAPVSTTTTTRKAGA